VFACTRKERQISRGGTPYLTVELRDSTGSIVARAFRDADLLAGRFERGELVRVAGRVARFREQLQIDIDQIARAEGAEADPARFLPRSYRDLDELDGFVEHLAREVYDPALRELLDGLLADRALREQLRLAPCTLPAGPPAARPGGSHHSYLGGLLEHTVAVATMAIELCTMHPRLDRDLLITAALVHDLGKTREFTYGAEIGRTREGELLGHVELGMRLLAARAPARLAPAARARALRAHSPRRRPGAGRALRLGRGGGALPAKRARREREGSGGAGLGAVTPLRRPIGQGRLFGCRY
jgi:3'-5' exoribonuclease